MKVFNDNGQQNPTPQIGDEVSFRCRVTIEVDCVGEVVEVDDDGSLHLEIIQSDLPLLLDETCIASRAGDNWYADDMEIEI